MAEEKRLFERLIMFLFQWKKEMLFALSVHLVLGRPNRYLRLETQDTRDDDYSGCDFRGYLFRFNDPTAQHISTNGEWHVHYGDVTPDQIVAIDQYSETGS